MSKTKGFLMAVVVANMAFTFSCSSSGEDGNSSEVSNYCVVEAFSLCVTGLSGKQCRDNHSGYIETECPYNVIIEAGSSSSFGGGRSSSGGNSLNYDYCIVEGEDYNGGVIGVCLTQVDIIDSCLSMYGRPYGRLSNYCPQDYTCTGCSSSSAALSSSSTLSSSSSIMPSSSSVVPSSSSSVGGLPTPTKTIFTDSRDGKTYKKVTIGTQTWMAENLNYRTPNGASRCYPISGSTNTSDADNDNCNTYGRLYDWSTAMSLASSCNSSSCSVQTKHKGICPTGWHIPSFAEWTTLTNYVDSSTAGAKLKSAIGWNSNGNGTDNYGFSALPGGGGNILSESSFSHVGDTGAWWSATEFTEFGGNSFAVCRDIYYDASYVDGSCFYKSYLLSVRCVKD